MKNDQKKDQWCCKLTYKDLVMKLYDLEKDIDDVCESCRKYPKLEEDLNSLILFGPLIDPNYHNGRPKC